MACPGLKACQAAPQGGFGALLVDIFGKFHRLCQNEDAIIEYLGDSFVDREEPRPVPGVVGGDNAFSKSGQQGGMPGENGEDTCGAWKDDFFHLVGDGWVFGGAQLDVYSISGHCYLFRRDLDFSIASSMGPQ